MSSEPYVPSVPYVPPVQERDGVPDTSGAPVIDVMGHLRELRHALLPALVLALLLGVLVGVVRSFVPPTYERSGTAHFAMTSDTISDTFAKSAAAQFESLGSDTEVLQAVAHDVGLPDGQAVADAVTVKANIAPGLLDVTAKASSPDRAEQLVRSIVTQIDTFSASRSGSSPDAQEAASVSAKLGEIDARIRAAGSGDSKTVAELYQQRQALAEQASTTAGSKPTRLTLLSLGETDGKPASPNPIPEGALVALVTFLLAAEAIVLFNSRVGGTVTPAWARRTGRGLGIDVDSAAVEDGRLPIPTEVHVKRLRDEGATVVTIDADGGTSGPDTDGGSTTDASFGLGERWWERTDLAEVDLAVLVCDESRTPKAEVLECLDTLAVANVPTRLVVREAPDFSGPFAWLKI